MHNHKFLDCQINKYFKAQNRPKNQLGANKFRFIGQNYRGILPFCIAKSPLCKPFAIRIVGDLNSRLNTLCVSSFFSIRATRTGLLSSSSSIVSVSIAEAVIQPFVVKKRCSGVAITEKPFSQIILRQKCSILKLWQPEYSHELDVHFYMILSIIGKM